ncbi:LysR family transcriptional regulator [Paenibacillus amylolyticus]|uniref:Transcriptional regulator, LysR family n=1 Tax=Paenibacillus amylolyticus TaxID=1451 RepID=A0A117I1G6_PAEAM|nr:LysR family transcriptional regulator [Paenibacillus amylolyticus]GAS82140.1 transcriptional regulator, LysR family [Paenibacillus amylolyticus]
MNHEEIETFLAVVEHGSILRGAQSLYISQSTATNRIQQLEGKLGAKLFYRQKGIKSLTLTPQGQNFLSIAKQWSVLWQEAQNLNSFENYTELRVSAVDMINSFMFVEVYKKMMKNHDHIVLNIQTNHSSKIHPMVDKQICDIGIVSGLYNYPSVKFVPLYQEDMVLVYNQYSLYAQTLDNRDLKSEDEIYLTWSEKFTLWHNRYFPYSKRKKIILGTASMLLSYFDEVNNWSIIPMSLANKLMKLNPSITYSLFDNPPPQRMIYLLINQYLKPDIQEAIQIFVDEIVSELEKNDGLTVLIENYEKVQNLIK